MTNKTSLGIIDEPAFGRRLATLRYTRPRCPRCGGVRLRKYRSIADQGDGSSLAWVRCSGNGCGHRFRVLLE